MKKYILIAGVNGAGKSTLFRTLPSLQRMKRINTDEILREFGDWRNTNDMMTAGKIAVRKIKEYFTQERSFNQETTLCGNAVLRNIKIAKEKGYFIELHYVGVESAEIAKERVRFRMNRGGHGIPEEDIERRYLETFKNLKVVLPYCNIVAFYDNTDVFRRFAIFKNGVPVRMSHDIPEWFQMVIDN